MPKITGSHPSVVPSTNSQTRAPQPAASPSQPTAPASWGSAPRTDAAERREKATGVSTRKAELTEAEQTQVVQKFPPGWETWKKTTADWAVNTAALALAAEKEVLKSKPR